MPNNILDYQLFTSENVDVVQVTNFSFGRTDGRTETGNNNIPELSLESAGITMSVLPDFFFMTFAYILYLFFLFLHLLYFASPFL